jgi:ATP-dependent DNA helicase RecG
MFTDYSVRGNMMNLEKTGYLRYTCICYFMPFFRGGEGEAGMSTVQTLPQNLLDKIRHGEDYQLEYKEAESKLPKNVYDTVSSFSNREGGDIFLGVHDCGVILGCDEKEADKMIDSFVTTINNPDKINPALFLTPVHYQYTSDGSFVGETKTGKRIQEQPGTYHIIHIHVPIATQVIRNAGRIYDRNHDADVDITNQADLVFQCYARKQSTYYVNKVFPFWKVSDLRQDLIQRARQMAAARKRRDNPNEAHPWEALDNEALLRSCNLILTDDQGRTGITLAAVLLFGTDNMIASACAHHKTDCIYRVYNLDRYDDRDVIDPTNLLDSYERMFDFGQKHLNDLFVLDGIQSVSARDAILREIISNSLAHRDYSNAFIAKMIIERDRILMENGNRAHGVGALNIDTFEPFPKNPAITKVFREIGFADELGSGMRNSYKYTKLYSGGEPEFIEGDVFKIIIPLTTGSMTKVGPGTQTESSKAPQPFVIGLEAEALNKLLDFCNTPRSRKEMMEFVGRKSQAAFRDSILIPMIESGLVQMTRPDSPKAPNQKYVRTTSPVTSPVQQR